MKLFKAKSRRSRIFAAVTVASVAILICLNLMLTYFGLSKTLFVDLTPEGLYTLTDGMKKECEFLNTLGEDGSESKVKITFCTDPDNLVSAMTTRPTYFMALKLQQEFPSVEVETVNVTMNPTAVAKYKTTSLSKISPSDVIVSYGDRYRIMGAQNFWTTGSSGDYFSYNGEYKMAGALRSVTLANEKQPTAYFLTDHGETYYDPDNPTSEMSLKTTQLANLLRDTGLRIKTLNLSEIERIPDNCALLIINNPTLDFVADPDRFDEMSYVSDTEKLDRYLVLNQGAIMVAKDYKTAGKMPVFEDFLREWGFEFGSSLIKDEHSSVSNASGTHSDIITEYDTNKENFGYAIYGEFAQLNSSPRTVISNTGYITSAFGESGTASEPGTPDVSKVYCSFLTTAKTAKPYSKNSDNGEYVDLAGEAKKYDLAAVTARSNFNSESAEYTYSYLFCANSADFFSNELLGNAAYANYDVTAALANNMSRMDYYASLEIGGTSLNSSSFGGKQLVSTTLTTEDTNVYSPDASELLKVNKGITAGAIITSTVIVAAVPVLVCILGIIVCVKRRFL